MATEYDRVLDEMIAICEALREGQSRQTYCKEKGITDCEPLSGPDPNPYAAMLAGAFVLNQLNLLMWLTLPPVTLLATHLWVKRFISSHW